jgi:hypothetical protein
MTVRLQGSTSGFTELDSPAVGANNILVLPTGNGNADQVIGTDGAGNLSYVNRGRMVLETARATTSGTAIDFTGIPSWVRRVTVMFSGVSTNGTSDYLIQLGTSGGVVSSGYISTGNTVNQANGTAGSSSTAGFLIDGGLAAFLISGHMSLTTLGSNSWASSHCCKIGISNVQIGGGDVTLSGTLDRLRLTTVNGTDTFDAGSVNLLLEG